MCFQKSCHSQEVGNLFFYPLLFLYKYKSYLEKIVKLKQLTLDSRLHGNDTPVGICYYLLTTGEVFFSSDSQLVGLSRVL